MYKAKYLEAKIQKDKNNRKWAVNYPTNWGVVDKDDYPVIFVANHHGGAMAQMIANLLNENKKYKIKGKT